MAYELTLIVPTLNEAGNLRPLVKRLHEQLSGMAWEVVFVDDDSTDGTKEVILELSRQYDNVRGIRRVGRRGLATACIEGMLSSAAPVLAVMDADLQHDETLLPVMLKQLEQERLDIISASRFLEGSSLGEFSSGRERLSRWGNRLSRWFCKADITDPMSGFFMLRRELLDEVVHRLSGQGFKILIDVMASADRPLRFKEVPLTFRSRLSGESKLDLLVTAEFAILLGDKLFGHVMPVRFLLFVAVGLLGVFVHLMALGLLLHGFGLSFAAAQAGALLVAMSGNFWLNNIFTYRDRRLTGGDFVTGLLTFYLACSIGALINYQLAESVYGLGAYWLLAGLVGAIVGSVWNFAVSSTFVWTRRQGEGPGRAGLGAGLAAGASGHLPFEPSQASDGHWLTAERAGAYSRMTLTVYLAIVAFWLLQPDSLFDPAGRSLGHDFMTFWSASHLAAAGDPAAVYDMDRLLEASRTAAPGYERTLIWNYAASFLLVVAPLAIMPFQIGYLIWSLAFLIPFLFVVRRLAPHPLTLWLLLAFPGSFVNLVQGQAGFLMAALFGGGLLLLGKRPILAGVLIGLISLKPHLGLLLPFALIAARQWTALAAAAVTAAALVGLSILAFGVAPWTAFWQHLDIARDILEQGWLPWSKMLSAFASLRLLGLPTAAAYAVQIALALAVAGGVALVWWRRTPLPLAAAVLVPGALLVSPLTSDYDLALLAVPIALLVWDGLQRGWRTGEREVLVLAWLVPIFVNPIAAQTSLQIGLPVVLALFVVALRRAFAAAPSVASQVDKDLERFARPS